MGSVNPSAEDIIATLRANEALLRRTALSMPHSSARAPAATIGRIATETEAGAVRTVYVYAGVKLLIEDLLPFRADVINRAFLKPSIRPVAERDLIHAF